MVCIICGSDTQVINSRLQKRLNQVWRRRKCQQCRAVFSTHEAAQYSGSWRVQTANGDLKPFLREQLFVSLLESCKHRQTALTDASALTDTIIAKLVPDRTNGIIQSRDIILAAQVALSRFDGAASVHYQAFHQL